ncbi:MAG: hypothetical protein ABTQ34_02250 [Bdellovibrionales bacterium]
MLGRNIVVRIALVCVVAAVGGGCTPMLRAAEASKWLNPNKWYKSGCGNCVESVSYNPESPDSAGIPIDSD